MVQSRAPEIGISLKIQYFHPYPNCQNGGEMGLCGVYCTVLKLIIILLQELLALCINNNIIISIITPLRLRGKYTCTFMEIGEMGLCGVCYTMIKLL